MIWSEEIVQNAFNNANLLIIRSLKSSGTARALRVQISFGGLILFIMTIKERILFAATKGYTVDVNGEVFYDGKKRKLHQGNTGRLEFAIRCPNSKPPQNIPVHRLQAYQKFKEKALEPGIVVRHLDGNHLNNSYDNIEIGTQQQNMLDIPKSQRVAHAKHAVSALIKYDANEIKKFYAEVKSYAKTMKRFNISSKGTLYFILKKR